ncbi:MAG: glycoside hydrolase family 2 TIM barrel-domain containing protein [Bacteroidota bacterium]
MQYTPEDISVSALSLNGMWRFIPDAPEQFYEQPYDDYPDAQTIPVPSSLEALFPQYVRGVLTSAGFVREVYIPEDWRDKAVKLQFESVDGKSTIYVNGKEAGGNPASFLPFEVDATSAIRFGEVNQVAVYITGSPTVTASHRGYLQISSQVQAIAVPAQHITSLHVETDLDESYEDAMLRLKVTVAGKNIRELDTNNLGIDLYDQVGRKIMLPSATQWVSDVLSSDTTVVNLAFSIEKPALWDPDHPHRYTLVTELKTQEGVHAVQHRIGFREIEVRGQTVYLNGRILKAKGVGYFHVPNYKTNNSVSRADMLYDLNLLKYANFNMVRAYPNKDVIEICDSLGLLTSIDTPINMVEVSWMKDTRGLGNNPILYADYQHITRQKIEVFRNHPSVVVWSLGNESIWTFPVFVDGGYLTQRLDSTRPLWAEAHEDERMGHNLPQTTIDNQHYPNLVDKGMPDQRPMFHGEWAHVHEYAKGDFKTDPTVRDHWVHSYEDHLEYMWNNDAVLGGYLFYGVSFEVRMRNVWNGAVERDWGILDRFRRTKPEFWNVKKANSSLRLQDSGFKKDNTVAEFRFINRSAFTNSSEMQLIVTLNGDTLEVPNPAIPPLDTGTVRIALPRAMQSKDQLLLDVYAPLGFLMDRFSLRIPTEPEVPFRSQNVSVMETGETIKVQGERYQWMINRTTGLISGGKRGEEFMIKEGPFLTATRQRTSGTVYAKNWNMDRIVYSGNDSNPLVVHVFGSYNEAKGSFMYRFTGDSKLEVEYDFEWLIENKPAAHVVHKQPDSQEMRETGIAWKLHHTLGELTWNREGYWSWYPDDHISRLTGTASSRFDKLPGYPNNIDRRPWFWEENEWGTRDFRSTKLNVKHVNLSHPANGSGVHFFSDGSQSTRAYTDPDTGNVYLVQIDQYGGGHEQFLQGNSVYSIPRVILDKGMRIKGKGTYMLE